MKKVIFMMMTLSMLNLNLWACETSLTTCCLKCNGGTSTNSQGSGYAAGYCAFGCAVCDAGTCPYNN